MNGFGTVAPGAGTQSGPVQKPRITVRRLPDRAQPLLPPLDVPGPPPELLKTLDITFRAFANVSKPFIQQSIVLGPPSLEAATRAFPQQRPFLRNSELFFKELRPGIRALRSAA